MSNFIFHFLVSFLLFLHAIKGTIGKWLLREGDSAVPGDAIAEIETDKASMAFECTDDIVIAKFLAAEGTEVKVGDPILVTVEETGDVAAFADFVAPASTAAAPTVSTPTSTPVHTPAATAPPTSAPTPTKVVTPPTRKDGERIFASPLAKRLARDAGVDLSNVSGSGYNGRIVAADHRGGQRRASCWCRKAP